MSEVVLRARVSLTNLLRRRRRVARYIRLSLDGEIDELPSPRPDFPFARFVLPPPPLAVSSLRRLLDQLAYDPRVEGVVLQIGCLASAATFQNLRQLVLDFRAKGKRVVACASDYGPFQYYLACACDQIVMPPSAEWSVVGLRREYVFLKDALDQAGLSVDVFNVSPFKSAGDQFTRTGFSAESRAQAEWLLDETYDELVRGIAQGRQLAEERVRELIAASPFSARDALKHGLIDAALYEDELEQFLDPAASDREESKRPPVLAHYNDVRRKLLVPYVRYAPEIIGVVSVEGMIVEGHSLSLPLPIPVPFFGSRTAGSDTVAEALRRAESDDRVAAIILYVNSSGGSALASDLIAREVKRVRTKKPVVAYMAGVAASGGYCVAAPANAIVAQSLTITGSIGVVVFRPNASGAYDKLHVHRAALQRGGRTGLLGVSEPLTGDEQQAILEAMARAYADFKRTVSEGRKLDDQALEPSCGGRVWTGAMAKERHLVDEVGDFTRAVDKARELAGLPAGVKMRSWLIPPPHKRLLPPPFLAQPAQWQWLASPVAALARSFSRAKVWAVLPWQHDGPTD